MTPNEIQQLNTHIIKLYEGQDLAQWLKELEHIIEEKEDPRIIRPKNDSLWLIEPRFFIKDDPSKYASVATLSGLLVNQQYVETSQQISARSILEKNAKEVIYSVKTELRYRLFEEIKMKYLGFSI